MCGFAGVLDLGGHETENSVLEAMSEVLTHRGPDGSGLLRSGPLGLGHRRLRILDLSERADQPMWDERGEVVIVFNGEIYNYRELRSELEAAGCRFRTTGDTEVILALYRSAGVEAVRRLDGMFALAIWDEKREKLFLARDRAGQKPLFYLTTASGFLFASETKAILRHPAAATEPNLDALPLYLTYGYFPAPETSYREVKALPPSTWMVVERDGSTHSEPYWTPRFEVNGIRRLPEAVERLAPLVERAVEKRLISDVPLGAFLSGGLDSSIVVGLMSRMTDRPVRTFSIGFEGAPEYDELDYAEEAAALFGTEHQSVRLAAPEGELIDRLVAYHDGPFGDSSAIPTYFVSKLARSEVTVALNGDGGDELFCGYQRLAAAAMSERIPRPLRQAATFGARLLPEPRSHASFLRRGRQFLEISAAPLDRRIQAWCSFFRAPELERLLGRHPAPDTSAHFRTVLDELPAASASPLARLLYLNYRTYLPEDLLVKMDRMSMAHGLEARSPFLDTALTEFAGSLPDNLKLRGFTTKRVLRETYRDLVPRRILHRSKMGFGVPVGEWFRGPLRPYLEAHLVDDRSALFRHLNKDAVKSYVAEHMARNRDHGQKLFSLLTLAVWLRSR